MSIEKQKKVANDILDKLSIIDPYCILAGGAPRDWYFGNEAKDLDFYFYSNGSTVSAVQSQLGKILGKDVKVLFEPVERLHAKGENEIKDLYKTMKSLVRIFEAEVDGIKCQLMQLEDPKGCFKVLDNMSVSICKVWYKGGKINLSKDFKLTLASKAMFLSEGYSWSDPHPKKIIGRFPHFCKTTKENCMKSVVNTVLREIGDNV